MKPFFYIAKLVQASGLFLIFYVLVTSALFNGDMGFMFTFTVTGMAIFMIGWMLQKIA